MQTGINRFNVNPKDGLAFLVEEGLVADSAESICGFLSSVDGLSKRRLGEYFGRVSGGTDGLRFDTFWPPLTILTAVALIGQESDEMVGLGARGRDSVLIDFVCRRKYIFLTKEAHVACAVVRRVLLPYPRYIVWCVVCLPRRNIAGLFNFFFFALYTHCNGCRDTEVTTTVDIPRLRHMVVCVCVEQDNSKAQKVLSLFLKRLKFKNASLDEALRSMVLKFRLPGEAQQMDRFVLVYWRPGLTVSSTGS